MISPLTNAIDPNSDTALGLTVVMFVLSFGLSFLTVSVGHDLRRLSSSNKNFF